jgi:hypothetical protein
MNPSRWSVAVLLSALAVIVVTLGGQQQQNAPHVAYVYPAGGQQDTKVQVRIGGRFLDGAAGVLVSGRGMRAEVVGYDKPLTGQQLTDLRDRVQEMVKKGVTPAQQKEVADARLRLGDSVRRNANPVLGEILTLDVTIDPAAEPGARQLRVQAAQGLTNPLVFVVGQVPEFREKDDKNGNADAETAITLPAVANGRLIPGDVDRLQFPARQPGQYMPGDVDRYRFPAHKGQDLVVAVSARDLMPYLADAVPGWFQAVVALYDAAGHEVAYDDDYRFHPDPVLHYRIPADGDFVVEIKDALYRGREDFVYRIAIGELPFITSAFPFGGRAGASTSVEVTGWNLGAAKVTMDVKDREPGIYPLTVRSGAIVSNRLPFAVDSLPETFEREPNNTAKTAQRLTLPVIVNGRIQEPGDWDVYSFEGRGGEQIVAEVYARRLESPLDSVLELTDANGRRLAFNDDHEDKAAALLTHQADSLLTATLPAGGTYYLRIGDTERKGGPEYGYRLRIGPPRPDFDLRVSPSEINAPPNASEPVTVTALRKDGFSGDIVLALKDAPSGFRLSGGVIPANQDQVRVTVTMPGTPTKDPDSVTIEGRATIQGRTVVRQAVPAEDMMQAFAYRHLVPTDDLRVSVGARGGTRVATSIVSAQPVKIPLGGLVHVKVVVPPAYLTFQNVQFELSEPPDGVVLGDLLLGRGVGQPEAEFVLRADAAKAKAGLRGNLIVTISGERAPAANPNQKAQQAAAARRRLPIGTLPAIAFEITPK